MGDIRGEPEGHVGRAAPPLTAFVLPLLFALLFLLTAQARAAFPGDNGKIAFSSNRDGNYEIYTMSANGAGLVRLTTADATDSNPAWSADGRKIVWEKDQTIWTMNADGSNQMVLSSDPQVAYGRYPSWSPNGGKIVFTRTSSSDTGVYVVNADGTGETGPINAAGVFPTDPGWSPSGQKIVFSGGDSGFDPKLYTVNPDGTGTTQITFNPGDCCTINVDTTPNWAPDSASILFRHFVDSGPGAGSRIVSVHPDGTNLVEIALETSRVLSGRPT
jgi:Tol biopolymer transport system component